MATGASSSNKPFGYCGFADSHYAASLCERDVSCNTPRGSKDGQEPGALSAGKGCCLWRRMQEEKRSVVSQKYPNSENNNKQLSAMSLKPSVYRCFMVARAGVQPATFALGVRCSMQLSYRATFG